jgi:uncharacterized protein (TIGR00375 family)
MDFKNLSIEAKKKGIHLVATGDCLHSGWFKEIKALEEIDEGTFELSGTRFILSTEVEDARCVHHLIFYPSLSSVQDFRERVLPKSKNMDTDGRPNLHMNGDVIAQHAADVDAIVGPCHAFTPWTAMYAYHDSLKSCYGDMTSSIKYLELGLSADTSYADRISELEGLTFLTNSDAHSPYPVRLAREFNRLDVEDATHAEVRKAILRVGGRKPIMNVGLPPQEGKYNESACLSCFTHYSFEESIARKWRCTCGKRIKRGVVDRINELASYPEPKHPDHRPPYLHVIPLAEIICKALGHSSPYTQKVFRHWNELIKAFDSEVEVLVDADLGKVEKATDPAIFASIEAFREGRILFHPGGGGEYGSFEIPAKSSAAAKHLKKKQKKRAGQSSLVEF